MRKYYSDYIRHCTRMYFAIDTTPNPLTDRVGYNNYIAVSNVLDRKDLKTVMMIKACYTSDDTLPKSVNVIAAKSARKAEEIWYEIQSYEKEVAIERGLI